MPFADETKREVWLALRADGECGAGSAGSPYDASSPALFRDRMKSFQAKTIIHIGPGIFQVPAFDSDKAVNSPALVWQPKSGQRIVGAGMYVTTLKVVGATHQQHLSRAIGNDWWTPAPEDEDSRFLDGFEVSDLTIDCNMRGHPWEKRVIIGAIGVMGRRTRIRRVRAIDFGSETHRPTGASWVECFVISACQAHPAFPETKDCVIEDCLIERPSPNSTYDSSCLIFSSGEEPDGGYMAYHRFCTVRRCVVDCQYQDRPVAIAGIARSGSTATVLTKTPHGRSAGEWVVITGALVRDSEEDRPDPDYPDITPGNPFNGSFPIAAVLDERRFQYNLTLLTKEGLEEAPPDPTGEMWLGKYSSPAIGIKRYPDEFDRYNPGEQPGVTVEDPGPGSNQWTVTIITEKPHLRLPGNNVNTDAITGVPAIQANLLNGLFPIAAVLNPTKLTFLLNESPGSPHEDQEAGAQIGASFVGITVDSGVGAVMEQNRVFNARLGVYHDTWSTKDAVIRKNHLHAVFAGIYQAMGQVSRGDSNRQPTRDLVSLTRGGTGDLTATATTSLAHGLATGQAVAIAGAYIDEWPAPADTYNGVFEIVSVPSPTSFSYVMKTAPSANADGSPLPMFGALWQVGQLVVERNAIDLVFHLFRRQAGPPYGIDVSGANLMGPYVFRQLCIRRNLLRNVDGAYDPSRLSQALRLDSCQRTLVESNVVDLNVDPAYAAIFHQFSRLPKYFNNQAPSGRLLQGYVSTVPTQYFNELGMDAELVSILTS
jgi:hypothetical protein